MPITSSGKKYVLNKVYALNKQVFKYAVMAQIIQVHFHLYLPVIDLC